MKIKISLEASEEVGYTAVVPSLPGRISDGDAKEEALRNIREAIELYLEPIEDDQIFPPNVETVELAYEQSCKPPPIRSNYKSVTAGWSGCGKTERKPCSASETYHY